MAVFPNDGHILSLFLRINIADTQRLFGFLNAFFRQRCGFHFFVQSKNLCPHSFFSAILLEHYIKTGLESALGAEIIRGMS